ncbi:aminopeptidase [Candidatus Acetothermia bacterium]|nr:aminopeptidase [Candidatus Acetothermia bacterium]
MYDLRVQKLANLLANYSLRLKKDQLFIINGNTLATPLAEAIGVEALRVGAHPVLRLTPPHWGEHFLREAQEHQLKYISEIERVVTDTVDAVLTIWGSNNTRALSKTNPKKMATQSAARQPLFAKFMERMAKGKMRWCGVQYPTEAHAQDFEMSLYEYEDFVYNACKLNSKNPVAEWQKVEKEQDRVIKELSKFSELHVVGDGTDVKLKLTGRKWVNACGHENMPDGEVFTSPVDGSVEGQVSFNFPTNYGARDIAGVKIVFKNGKVIRSSADQGEDFLKSMLALDEGASLLGEFAIGLNYNIQNYSKNTLFDEKIGGTVHFALGAAFPECNGKNKSGLHWDMVLDLRKEGAIYGDGEKIFEKGKLLI